MAIMENVLRLDRCPHCGIARPFLQNRHHIKTEDSEGRNSRMWVFYACTTCGGIVMISGRELGKPIDQIFPDTPTLAETIPDKARELLNQAINSLHAPTGAVMLTASSIDSMLKEKGYSEGSLYSRINKAKDDHLITEDMATWAHEVRLDANDQRHSDLDAALPNKDHAIKCIEFAKALAQFLFVLPAMVNRGLQQARQENVSPQ